MFWTWPRITRRPARKAPVIDDPNHCVDAATRAKVESTAALDAGEETAARTTGNPADFARAMREAVARIDPNLAVGRLGTLAEFARASVARERFSAALLGAFAALSILLASVGIYGVMAYVVARRSRELGLRAALGASPRALFAQIAGRGLVLTAIGGTIGLVGALAAGRLLSGLLFDTAAADPLTIGAVAVLLPAITLAAFAVPARRAARVDPIAALRAE